MKRARVLHDRRLAHGVVAGNSITLETGASIPADTAAYLPPIEPRQIIAAHLTYRSRCVEYRMASVPAYPSYFMKPLGTVSHHGAAVARPRGCRFLNYEGEIAVVIGRTCSNVTLERALDYVKGYTAANDFGLHDFRHADRNSMFRVKGQDGFCPLGPVLVDAGDVNPDGLWLRTFVNGTLVQEARTGDDMIFSIAYQIADVSRLVTLEENDVLLTGTPANSRPLDVGDTVAVEVSGIGRLQNHIVELDRDLIPIGDQPQISDQTLHVALAIPEEEARARVRRGQS
ncbi:MAG TPA: fumarylacetoacetate hydrolase family protein [Vicinamibacterales bacterium]|nr:fumarylacetoacetate hydrolase family protein [Vicinamibacterales bacterium]